MHKLDPNDMDALFRDGADKHEFSYNPEAWAMMEDKLDKKDQKKYFLWFFFGAILLAGIVGIYLFANTGNTSNLIAAESNVEIINNDFTIAEKEVIDIKKENTTENNDENSSIESNKIIDSDQLVRPSNNQIENKTKIKTATDNSSEVNEDNNNTVSKVRSSDIVAQYRFQSENTGNPTNNEIVSVSSQNIKVLPSEISTQEDVSDIISSSNKIGSISQNEERELLDLDELEKTTNSSVSSLSGRALNFNLRPIGITTPPIFSGSVNRYVFTAFTSADFSSVGFFKDPQSGFTIGGKVGLQTARKFQFDLGFAYSLKRYGSEGQNYNLEGGWNSMVGINPTWMDGKGNILQIPLEASYYINGFENNSFFLNVGVSSFLLNSEWYGFTYDPADLFINPNPIEEITMDDIPRRNFHLAGIARVSVGYQKIISPNMAFELSPYLQIPLTGIGEGKVDLYTAGVQFAIKFNTK